VDYLAFVFLRQPSQPDQENVDLLLTREMDAVCLLSGDIDSLAAGVNILDKGRRPLFMLLRGISGMVTHAQQQVVRLLETIWPGQSKRFQVRPFGHFVRANSLTASKLQLTERSRGTYWLFFMTLGIVAAIGVGAAEVYLGCNGAQIVAEALTPAHGSISRLRGTHPIVLTGFNKLISMLGWSTRIVNLFVYQTKGELISSSLLPVLRPQEIAQTTCCLSPTRTHHQCGSCVPCLLRRIAMLNNGLPEGTSANDVLGHPS